MFEVCFEPARTDTLYTEWMNNDETTGSAAVRPNLA